LNGNSTSTTSRDGSGGTTVGSTEQNRKDYLALPRGFYRLDGSLIFILARQLHLFPWLKSTESNLEEQSGIGHELNRCPIVAPLRHNGERNCFCLSAVVTGRQRQIHGLSWNIFLDHE